ncbi:hypothetical protein ACQ86N_45675 [Puia sp. P3]|uniref:hypothetical protein n=1 Tax=Puia sp. P3 TaxID=3423952 RepID=UPI003D66841F
MKIVYMCVFFGDTLLISVLAFQLFQSIDTGAPVWVHADAGLAWWRRSCCWSFSSGTTCGAGPDRTINR